MIRSNTVAVGWLLVACVIIGYALAGTVKAEPTDPATTFAVDHAADVCLALDTAPTINGLLHVLQGVNNAGLAPTEAGYAIGLSVKYVCPIHLPLVREFITQMRGRTIT